MGGGNLAPLIGPSTCCTYWDRDSTRLFRESGLGSELLKGGYIWDYIEEDYKCY